MADRTSKEIRRVTKKIKWNRLLSILTSASLFAGLAAAVGAEDLQVNAPTKWSEERPTLAMNAAGELVIVWLSDRAEGDSFGSIQGRLYAADGEQLGDQLRINTETLEDERNPVVALNAAGEFVVAWTRVLGFDGETIEYQRLAADGAKVGEQLMASYDEDAWARHPAVAMDDEGSFVVAWDFTRNFDDYTIQARRFDAKLGQLGDLIRVSHLESPFQDHWGPSVAMTAGGDSFVVAWKGRIPGASGGYEILARRFAGDGTPLGVPFQVNTQTAGEQSEAVVAIDAEGNFAIAWESESSLGSDASGLSIQVRRFASDGTPFGPEVQANTYTLNDQRRPSVAMTPTGEFAVAWLSYGSPTQGERVSSLQLQRFRADGSFAAEPVEVNTTPIAAPNPPRIGLDAAGSFVATWTVVGGLGTDLSTPVVRSRMTGWSQIFGDGFESGTAGNWSLSQP
jgi:hypothetical protein